jgi:hypothetical protein
VAVASRSLIVAQALEGIPELPRRSGRDRHKQLSAQKGRRIHAHL